MMKFGSLGAVVAAAGMCFLTFVPAQATTVGEALDAMGDMFVLENMCPDLYKDVVPIKAYMAENGITDSLLNDTSFYSDELEAAAKRSFAERKFKSKEDNCAEAITLYGTNGTSVKGVFIPAAERVKSR